MTTLLLALGLVFAVEGLLYAVAPGFMRDMLAKLQDADIDTLRIGGIISLAAGVFFVWLARL